MMADVVDSVTRSRMMSGIRGRNTKPEILLRKAIWGEGFRYSLKSRLPGRPDVVLTRFKIAIFVDGCFWHRCPVHYKSPAGNQEFWTKKIEGNVARDLRNTKALKEQGWVVLRFWEHDVEKRLPVVLRKILRLIGLQKAVIL